METIKTGTSITLIPESGEQITKITPMKKPIGFIFYLEARYGKEVVEPRPPKTDPVMEK